MYEDISKELLEFIEQSPTAFHAVANFEELLGMAGFEKLDEREPWSLEAGHSYYVTRNGSSVIAFALPAGTVQGFNIAAAHSDSPLFKIKANPEMTDGNYVRLNIEKYGGMLCQPWFDRPLAIAGRVIYRAGENLKVKLIDTVQPVAIIPSLAIHMDREANDGHKINVQTDMPALIGSLETKGSFAEMVGALSQVPDEAILGQDLFVYNTERGCIWGMNNEYISSRALDDLMCAWSIMQALLNYSLNERVDGDGVVAMGCIFDNEEVGSTTAQGADSTFLSDVLAGIAESLSISDMQMRRLLASSFMISADNGHAIHPNHPEKADPTNKPVMNGGVVLKYNANQKYTTDGVSESIFKLICERAEVPYQTYCNRSDIPGGSTLGNISNSHVSLKTVDVGLAQLAMHSPYETAGVKDAEYFIRVLREFFKEPVQRVK